MGDKMMVNNFDMENTPKMSQLETTICVVVVVLIFVVYYVCIVVDVFFWLKRWKAKKIPEKRRDVFVMAPLLMQADMKEEPSSGSSEDSGDYEAPKVEPYQINYI